MVTLALLISATLKVDSWPWPGGIEDIIGWCWLFQGMSSSSPVLDQSSI